MKIIKATTGEEIIVSDCDFDLLNRHAWMVDKSKGYVVTVYGGNKIYMHRLVFGKMPTGHFVVDHINRNKLDNRLENLRRATVAQNSANAVYTKGSTGLIGVKPRNGKFYAKASVNNKDVHIGVCDTAEDAGKLRDCFVYKLRGEFSTLNFPDLVPEYSAWEPPTRLLRYFN